LHQLEDDVASLCNTYRSSVKDKCEDFKSELNRNDTGIGYSWKEIICMIDGWMGGWMDGWMDVL
jgi:hypothetical protein